VTFGKQLADAQERLDTIPLYRQEHEFPKTVQITLSDTPISREEAQDEESVKQIN
jgi:hypothetical protein